MKKALTIAASALFVATSLCGCGKSTAKTLEIVPRMSDTVQSQTESDTTNTDNAKKKKIEIYIDGDETLDISGELRKKSALSGVRRHFGPDRSGTYTVEYVHAPYGIDKDETLDYKLNLNDDNTFTMTVVADGVTSEHSGRWYERRSEIMMFYDEPIQDIAHNVYIADSLFGNLMPKGKIMIYDNCYTIVLSRQPDTADNGTTELQRA